MKIKKIKKNGIEFKLGNFIVKLKIVNVDLKVSCDAKAFDRSQCIRLINSLYNVFLA